MSTVTPTAVLDAVRRAAGETPGLRALVMFGSRARGDAHAASDWDFGYLSSHDLDVAQLLATLVETVGSDRVDLVDLRRAGGLLRFNAARDGQTMVERDAGLVDRFRFEAVQFWCDAEPILRHGYEHVLSGLTQ
jgi:predicted nucleotidyltransferase